MGRVLVELEKSNSTTELTKACLQMIFAECDIEAQFRFLGQITQEDLNWCDSYLAVRPNSPKSLSLAKSVKSSGRFYAVMFDDDLLNRDGALGWRIKSARECIKLADVVVSPNPLLAEEYAQLTDKKRHVVINTPVSETELIPTHQHNDPVRFVYAAGRDHAEYFEKLLKPVLNDFLNRYANRVHFTFIGVEPDVTGLIHKECFTFVPLMSLDDYNKYMRTNLFDIGLAPLDDTHFSNRKYFNKFIEYSKVGITGLYSDCLPFTLIVQNGVNGILVNNTHEEWYHALVRAINNKNDMEQCAVAAQTVLTERFSVCGIADVVAKQITEFIEYKNDEKIEWKEKALTYKCFEIMDKVKKLIYQVSHNGFKSTINLIRNHIDTKS